MFKSTARNYIGCCAIPYIIIKKILLFFFTPYKTGGKEINFKDKKINKKDFYNNKKQFNIKDIDINKILISEAESYGKYNTKKYIIGYSDEVIRELRIFLPQMIGYVKCFKDNKTMFSLADYKELLKENTKVWEKIRDLIGKKADAEPVYGDKYINTKIKLYNNDIGTNFHGEGNNRKISKESCSYKCLSLISLDSVIKMGKKYYLQTLLEECKVEDLITDDFDSSSESDGESDSESDGESGDE